MQKDIKSYKYTELYVITYKFYEVYLIEVGTMLHVLFYSLLFTFHSLFTYFATPDIGCNFH